MKISCTIGRKGSWSDHDLPTIGKAGDILELIDYPEEGLSKQYLCIEYHQGKKRDNADVCDLCEMDYMSDGKTRRCLYMECKCQCNSNSTYLCAIDRVLEDL